MGGRTRWKAFLALAWVSSYADMAQQHDWNPRHQAHSWVQAHNSQCSAKDRAKQPSQTGTTTAVTSHQRAWDAHPKQVPNLSPSSQGHLFLLDEVSSLYL